MTIQTDLLHQEDARSEYRIRSALVSFSKESGLNLASHTDASPEVVFAARRQLQTHFPQLQMITWLRQHHTTDVIFLKGGEPADQIVADAVVTDTVNLACAILTADCVPILLADTSTGRVAAVHGGWRGLANGILVKALAFFPNPSAVRAYIGPCISQGAFEVGIDVLDAFDMQASAKSTFFQQTGQGHWHADLVALTAYELRQMGIATTSITRSSLSTDTAPHLPSYRLDKTPLRMASLIWIEPI